jgi:hypothetical protein
LFIHGGGDRGYEADAPLAASLRKHLGANTNVRYPMPQEESPDFGWGRRSAARSRPSRDQEIDISNLATYETSLPQAIVRAPATGGHQFNDDLSLVARDIRGLV